MEGSIDDLKVATPGRPSEAGAEEACSGAARPSARPSSGAAAAPAAASKRRLSRLPAPSAGSLTSKRPRAVSLAVATPSSTGGAEHAHAHHATQTQPGCCCGGAARLLLPVAGADDPPSRPPSLSPASDGDSGGSGGGVTGAEEAAAAGGAGALARLPTQPPPPPPPPPPRAAAGTPARRPPTYPPSRRTLARRRAAAALAARAAAAPAAPPPPPPPPTWPALVYAWSASLGAAQPTTPLLACHLWRRARGGLLGGGAGRPAAVSRAAALAACVWVACKHEEARSAVPSASAVAALARSHPAALRAAELAVLGAVGWRPLDGWVGRAGVVAA